VLYYQQRLMQAEPQARTLKNFGNYLKFMFIAPAMMPRLALPWLDYLRPGFHPWDHNNRYLLREIDTLVARTEAYGLKAA
jgi:predicted metal-dependent hydrolase